MMEPDSASRQDGEGRPMGRTYVAVILVEIVTLLVLWSFSQYFA